MAPAASGTGSVQCQAPLRGLGRWIPGPAPTSGAGSTCPGSLGAETPRGSLVERGSIKHSPSHPFPARSPVLAPGLVLRGIRWFVCIKQASGREAPPAPVPLDGLTAGGVLLTCYTDRTARTPAVTRPVWARAPSKAPIADSPGGRVPASEDGHSRIGSASPPPRSLRRQKSPRCCLPGTPTPFSEETR